MLVRMGNLVSASALADAVYHGRGGRLLGCYWRPKEHKGREKFTSEHIPTAHYCDPQTALAGVPGDGDGRNPLPDPDILQRWWQRWGVRIDRPVTVYDEGRGLYAARAWWVLRWAGLRDVKILDGGLATWLTRGYRVLGGPGNLAQSCTVRVNPGQMPVATLQDVIAADPDVTLIDTRETPRYAGEREVLDLKAGHIPGAINIPNRDLLHEDCTFRSPEEIRDRFAREGITPETPTEKMIIYSGSGNHSAQVIAAMEDAGLQLPRHFVGGWSQWCATPALPVERGRK